MITNAKNAYRKTKMSRGRFGNISFDLTESGGKRTAAASCVLLVVVIMAGIGMALAYVYGRNVYT